MRVLTPDRHLAVIRLRTPAQPDHASAEHAMNGQDSRPSGMAPGIPSLGAGLVFVVGLAGWATPADQPNQSFPSSQFLVTGAVAPPSEVGSGAPLSGGRSDRPAAQDESQRTASRDGGRAIGYRDASYPVEEGIPNKGGAAHETKSTVPKVENPAFKVKETVRITGHGTEKAPALPPMLRTPPRMPMGAPPSVRA